MAFRQERVIKQYSSPRPFRCFTANQPAQHLIFGQLNHIFLPISYKYHEKSFILGSMKVSNIHL